MDWIMLVIAFILGAISMFCIRYAAKQEKPVNRIHFYVARDKNGKLFLYMRKPLRTSDMFISSRFGSFINEGRFFSEYGLNCDDFKDLKWEDEPVEVFINMED